MAQDFDGYNGMQARAGLLPGGMPGLPPINIPMGMPPVQTPHPGQVSAMLQQQAMMGQYATPMPSQMFGSTMVGAPGMFGPGMPPPLMGMASRARREAVESQNRTLAFAQSGAGLLGRLGGNLMATAMGGPLGAFAFEALGGGQAMQNLFEKPFQPFVEQRARALNFQNQSTRFVVGGNDLSATGQGMSMGASQQVIHGINRLADSSSFRRETGGMFNRGDLDRITRLSGELGMLDQASSADQITREVKKVSKALSNFMKLAEEPDIQKAMQQMARMRNIGFAIPEIPAAAQNARTFARMAGVSVSEVMAGAERGVSLFQSAGFSGAAGFQAGLGAQGFSRIAGTGMNERQLAMAGGVGGIEQTMLRASLHTQTIDAMLPAMLTRRGGQLAIDPDAIHRLATGQMTPGDLARQGTSNMRGLGPGTMGELFTQRRELQDRMATMLGPQGQMMLPLLMATQIQRQTGGRVTIGNALQMQGLSEQEARTMELTAQNPEFFRDVRRQMQITQRDRAVSRRDATREFRSFSATLGRRLRRGIGEPIGDFVEGVTTPINEFFADHQDADEALALQGEGPARVLRRGRLGSDVTDAATRTLLRSDPKRVAALSRSVSAQADRLVAAENAREGALAHAPGVGGILARQFTGPEGFGLTRAGRGGDTYRSAVVENMGLNTRIADFFGMGPSQAAVQAAGRDMEGLSRIIERSSVGGSHGEHTRALAASRSSSAVLGGNRERADRAIAAAAEGVRTLVAGHGGTFQSAGGEQGLRSAVRAQLEQQGIRGAEADRLMNDQNFMASAMSSARRGMSEEDRGKLDSMGQAGRDARGLRQGQSEAAYRRIAEGERNFVASRLGLRRQDAESARKVIGMLSGSGDGQDTELRRKIFTAQLMARSSNAQTRQQGNAQLEALRRQSPEKFEQLNTAIEREIEQMPPEVRERMAGQVAGKSLEQASQFVQNLAQHAERAQGADIEAAGTRLLGAEGLRAYREKGVQGLRENASQVTDRRIRRMLEEGKSDQEIERALNTRMQSEATSAGATAAAGAEATEEEAAETDTMEEMISAISEGMEEFPGAVQRLDEASRRLSDTADRLADAAGIARVAGGLEAGSGESRGFWSNLNPFS